MPALLSRNLQYAAENFGDHCAVKHGDRQISYTDLWQGSCGVAQELVARGMTPGDRAAVILPNSIEYVQSLYGVLLAGGIAVPMNAAAKSRDLLAWLGHCRPGFVFFLRGNHEVEDACRHLTHRFEAIHPHDDNPGFDMPAPNGRTTFCPEPAKGAPAMIIYTSGTTGSPKGVTLSHGNLSSNTEAIVESLQLQRGERMVSVLPFHFSYGNSVLHTHVRVAGTLILEQNLVYPHMITQALQSERATGFAGVPSTYALLLARGRIEEHDLSSLRYVTQAGGPMPAGMVGRLRRALPHVKFFAMYGQTEATARISCLPADQLDARPGSVGIPVPGVTVQIRKDGMVVPSEVEGEIWVSGPGVMLGYWLDPASTEATVEHGWLRTGDIGRMDVDGYLYVLGRRSDMIKVGANRIHPADIEEAVSELPTVREVAAIGVDDEVLGQAVKVLVVPHENAEVTAMQVQAHCRAHLPSYKIPKSVVIVSSLPRTSSGKVHRAELARQESQ